MVSWLELEKGLRDNTTIDETTQSLLELVRKHMSMDFERLIAIVLLLSDQNLAFRVGSYVLYTPSNGNFWAQVEF